MKHTKNTIYCSTFLYIANDALFFKKKEKFQKHLLCPVHQFKKKKRVKEMKNISFCCYGWNVSVLLKNHEQNVGMIFFPEWIRQHQKCKIRYLKNIFFDF